MILGREDQRELNNLGKMIPEQGQSHMMVIDEAKAAHDLLVIARELLASSLGCSHSEKKNDDATDDR